MRDERPNFFAGPYIERRAEEREDPQWLAAARADGATRYLVSRGTAQLLSAGPEPHIAFLANDAPLLAAAAPESFVLLGWYRGARCVLADLPVERAPLTALPADTQLAELRPLSAVLPAEEAGLLAYARALVIWRARHRHDRCRRSPGLAGISLPGTEICVSKLVQSGWDMGVEPHPGRHTLIGVEFSELAPAARVGQRSRALASIDGLVSIPER